MTSSSLQLNSNPQTGVGLLYGMMIVCCHESRNIFSFAENSFTFLAITLMDAPAPSGAYGLLVSFLNGSYNPQTV